MIQTQHKRRHGAGFMLLDVLTGIVVGLAVLAILSASVARYHHGSRRLFEQRAAVHLAERVLTDLQAGQAPKFEDGGFTSRVTSLAAPGPTLNTRWVEVRVEGPANFSLVGLAPIGGPDASSPTPTATPVTRAEVQP